MSDICLQKVKTTLGKSLSFVNSKGLSLRLSEQSQSSLIDLQIAAIEGRGGRPGKLAFVKKVQTDIQNMVALVLQDKDCLESSAKLGSRVSAGSLPVALPDVSAGVSV